MANHIRLNFNNNVSAKFKMVDNPVGDAMWDIFFQVYRTKHFDKIYENNKLEIDSGHGAFNSTDDPVEIERKLKEFVKRAEDLGVKMPSIPEEIDRDTLNRIHEDFHVVEEQYIGTRKRRIPGLQDVLAQVNFLVHRLESSKKFIGMDKNYWVFQPAKFHHITRKPLSAEIRKHFLPAYPPHRVTLEVGYSTIGKNLMHCVYDNDIELVERNLLRPQLSISTESTFNFYSDWEKLSETEAQKKTTFEQAKYKNNVKDFVIKNNLTGNVGYSDPIHLNSVQPVYAYLADNGAEDWSTEYWSELFQLHGLGDLELLNE